MKVCYLSRSTLPSTAANSVHVMKMCRALAMQGHDVELVACRPQGAAPSRSEIFEYYAVDPTFEIALVDRPRYKGKYFVYSVRGALRVLRSRPDLVYGRDTGGCMLAALCGFTTVLESHAPLWQQGSYEHSLFRVLAKSRNLKRIVVISKVLENMYRERAVVGPKTDLLVAHDAADFPAPAGRLELDGRPGVLQVGYVGGLYEGKGLEVVQQVAPLLPGVDFHIVGGSAADIESWRSRMNAPNVRFHGYVKQQRVAMFLDAFDVCLLPNQRLVRAHGAHSRSPNISAYTSPLKLFEYMAHRKAIVASDLPVIREVLDESMACLVDPDDIAGWVDALRRLENAQVRTWLGSNAFREFACKYVWEKRAAAVLAGVG